MIFISFFLLFIFNIFSLQAEDAVEQSLSFIEHSLKTHNDQLQTSQDQIQAIESRLQPLLSQQQSLQQQMSFFENSLLLSQAKIHNTEILLFKIEQTIQRLESSTKEHEIYTKDAIQNIEKCIQIITKNPHLSLQEQKFLHSIIMYNVSQLQLSEEKQKQVKQEYDELKKQRIQLATLQNDLKEEVEKIQLQKQAKSHLLSITQGREETYQQLIKQHKEQMEESSKAVETLYTNKQLIESKLLAFETSIGLDNKETQRSILEETLKNLDFDLSKVHEDMILQTPLMWPINPKKGISAGFKDASYESYFGVAHYAIDIPTPQETPIYAPTSGYVQKITDNGMGYSYILLGHKDGLSTLYGHVSDIQVQEGDLIQMGQQIGLTGGTPGTRGAGVMTTGPHLHFEVHKNGEKVNPLGFLPKGFY